VDENGENPNLTRLRALRLHAPVRFAHPDRERDGVSPAVTGRAGRAHQLKTRVERIGESIGQ